MANRYLLDTHTLLWFQENNPRIPKTVMDIIQDPENIILFSQVSLFEIGIKQSIGKLPGFYASVEEVYQQAINDGFTFLPIQNKHIYRYNKIPLFDTHRDHFDRLLIATAAEENTAILSQDQKLGLYSKAVKVTW